MDIITNTNVYQYVSMILATTFLVPQTYSGFQTQSLKDVSGMSLFFVFSSSTLWAFYMYDNEKIYYSFATAFVGLNALVLGVMKTIFYYKRVNEHYKSFDQPPPQIVLSNNQIEST
tara:strand:+ start:822 stop:1169 length:348 start_codon:yes stop_codon:yes gene_type:complete